MISGILPFQANGGHYRAEMRYDETKPFEISFVFRAQCAEGDCSDIHDLTWIVGRDLLSEGVDSETWAGEGHFRLRRDSHNALQIVLNPPEGSITLSVPRKPLKDFIKLSFDLVDAGKESDSIDWDEFDAEREEWAKP